MAVVQTVPSVSRWCVMGSLTLGPQTGTSCQIGDGNRLEIKGTIDVRCFNHPETIPTLPWSVGKLSSSKPVPGVKQVVVCWCVVSSFLGIIFWLLFFFFSEHKTCFLFYFNLSNFILISIIADHVLNLKRNFSKYHSNFGRLIAYKATTVSNI